MGVRPDAPTIETKVLLTFTSSSNYMNLKEGLQVVTPAEAGGQDVLKNKIRTVFLRASGTKKGA
jgi:hypothetical protein